MKKTLILLLIGMIVFSMAAKDSQAAKKSKKSAAVVTQDDLNAMTETIDNLTRKVYSNSLFSPEDNSKMIEVKIKLDNQMLVSPDLSLAPLYYKAGNLYLAREYKKEAIECYQTILENFPDTALAPKATQALKKLGVEIVTPVSEETEQDGTATGQAADIIQTDNNIQTDIEQPQLDNNINVNNVN